MNLTYAGVKLQICTINAFSEKSVATDDGVDLLVRHYYIDVQCEFHPQATASLGGGGNPGNLLPGKQSRPIPQVTSLAPDLMPVSVVTLFDTLMTHRQQLVIDIGGSVILQAPLTLITGANGQLAACDANNGPKPLGCQVVAFNGTKSASVRFQIECWIRSSGSPVLISNRWSMTETVDMQYYSTFSVEGRAIFRPDLLLANGNVPDDYRPLIVPPQAKGCQRQNLRVTAMPDGCTVTYSFNDVQQQYYFIKDIVKAQGKEWYGCSMNTQDIKAALDVPVATNGISVTVWGKWITSRATLARAVMHILAGSGIVKVKDIAAIFSTSISVDFPSRTASGSLQSIRSGLTGSILNFVNGVGQGQSPDDFKDEGNDLWSNPLVQGDCPQMPGNGRYGSFAARLVTQALGAPSVQPVPVVMPTYANRQQDVTA